MVVIDPRVPVAQSVADSLSSMRRTRSMTSTARVQVPAVVTEEEERPPTPLFDETISQAGGPPEDPVVVAALAGPTPAEASVGAPSTGAVTGDAVEESSLNPCSFHQAVIFNMSSDVSSLLKMINFGYVAALFSELFVYSWLQSRVQRLRPYTLTSQDHRQPVPWTLTHTNTYELKKVMVPGPQDTPGSIVEMSPEEFIMGVAEHDWEGLYPSLCRKAGIVPKVWKVLTKTACLINYVGEFRADIDGLLNVGRLWSSARGSMRTKLIDAIHGFMVATDPRTIQRKKELLGEVIGKAKDSAGDDFGQGHGRELLTTRLLRVQRDGVSDEENMVYDGGVFHAGHLGDDEYHYAVHISNDHLDGRD